jgi:hypothetical protein
VQSWYREMEEADRRRARDKHGGKHGGKAGVPQMPTVWQFYRAIKGVVLAQGGDSPGGTTTGRAVLVDVLGVKAV